MGSSERAALPSLPVVMVHSSSLCGQPAAEARAESAPAPLLCSPGSTMVTSQSSQTKSVWGSIANILSLCQDFSIKGGSGLLSHEEKIEFCYLSGEDKNQLLKKAILVLLQGH